TRIFWASSRSTCIRSASPQESCGAMPPRRVTPFTSIFGTATLSTSELQPDSERLAALPTLPRDGEGPVFAEPWQAQAFALAVRLSAQGHFTWKEWAAALADELKSAAHCGEPDDGSRYYEHWLAALERLVAEKGLSGREEMLDRKNAWVDAYRHTPHG